MKYLRKTKLRSGKVVWHFNPPQDTIDAGVVSRKTFTDGRTARARVPELLERIELYRKGELAASTIGANSSFAQVAAHYSNTKHFQGLAENTKKAYLQTIKSINSSKLLNKEVGSIKISKFDSRKCSLLYESWCNNNSVAVANTRRSVFSSVFRHAMSFDVVIRNPMASIRPATHTSEQVVWTKAQVDQFLDTAFSKFEWRNVGLIAALAYDWCQRPIDIRLLKWESINLDEGWAKFKQEKRGTRVELPISEALGGMLQQQLEDFGHQPYVAPYFRTHDGTWAPYTRDKLSRDFTKIREEAGLPEHLNLSKLRPTGINEMVEKHVDIATMKSVTGHKNLQSLSPYVKNTLSAAKAALDKRNS